MTGQIEIVEGAGTAVAFPSQTLYLRPDSGSDGEKIGLIRA